MATPKMNTTNKALKSTLAKLKKFDYQALLEYEIAFQNNSERGKVWNQSEILAEYGNRNGDARGASKVCHLYAHDGSKFQYIVVKRHNAHGWMPDVRGEHEECTGNQMIDEINCWQKLALTEDGDCLCPILKYFTSKSDQVSATSRTMIRNVVIIAQKAVYVSDAKDCCCEAERLNRIAGYKGEAADTRYNKLKKLSEKQGWRDAIHNGGNSGVIFDYDKQCYKAVFIDYAL